MLVACESAAEAHYVCAALNSIPARAFIASYVATHVSTHPIALIDIPRFSSSNETHALLAKASVSAHSSTQQGSSVDEEAVDRAAAALWGLSAQDAAALGQFLDKLLKRDLRE